MAVRRDLLDSALQSCCINSPALDPPLPLIAGNTRLTSPSQLSLKFMKPALTQSIHLDGCLNIEMPLFDYERGWRDTMGKLTNQVAVVTGASKGIGAAIA